MSVDNYLCLCNKNINVNNFRGYAGYIDKMRPLVNLTAFITRQTRMGFSEVTGGRALSFCNVSMGETAGLPLDRAGAMRRGQNSPVDTLLKRPAREPWS